MRKQLRAGLSKQETVMRHVSHLLKVVLQSFFHGFASSSVAAAGYWVTCADM